MGWRDGVRRHKANQLANAKEEARNRKADNTNYLYLENKTTTKPVPVKTDMAITMETVLNFGKYKGCKISDMLRNGEDATDETYRSVFRYLEYLTWIRYNTKYVLSNEVMNRMGDIDWARDKNLESNETNYKSKRGRLEHHNDMGAMNDLSFEDAYGTFGY